MKSPHLEQAKLYWKNWLKPGDAAVDATCGNGWDTLFLAQLPLSFVFACDLQQTAIDNTHILLKNKLSPEQYEKVHLHRMSHGEFDRVAFPIQPRLIVYNLGYLPGGDKSLTTRTETTLASVQLALSIVGTAGALSITCYPGHEEGAKEESELCQFVKSLSSKEWMVCYHQWINRPRSPSLFWIASSQTFFDSPMKNRAQCEV